jgi:hypothetical protein
MTPHICTVRRGSEGRCVPLAKSNLPEMAQTFPLEIARVVLRPYLACLLVRSEPLVG